MTRAGYDFWLFDLDGTLVDIEPWYPRAVIARVGDELAVEFTDREAEVLWYGMGPARGACLADHSITPEAFWRTFHEVENPRERARATFLYDDAEAFVSSVSGPVGLVTHCQRYLTDPVLDGLDVREWFDSVVCCSDATGWKPDPDPVHRLMRMLDVDPGSEGVLIGDDPVDVDAARAAGLDAVRVDRRRGSDGPALAIDETTATTDGRRPATDGNAPVTDGRAPATDGGHSEDGTSDEPVIVASLAELS